MQKRIEEWYRGSWVAPPPNDPNSQVVFISAGHHDPHWTARVAQGLVGFWLARWPILIGFAISLAGLLIAYK
jgi:hypothetical protein